MSGLAVVGDLTLQGNGAGVTIISGEINVNNSNGTLNVEARSARGT